jgi:integrase
MATWNTSETTRSRDTSVMRTHVMPHWAGWPLAKIDHLSIQAWVTDVGRPRGPHTVSRSYLLLMGVLRSAVRNRLIATNPGEEVKLPKVRRSDTDERIISRHELRTALLPAVPERHRALIATTAGTGLRWGEAIGLRRDVLDLERPALTVIRTVIEVNGHTSFKPFPKSSAGRRTVPLPAWVLPVLLDHLDRWPAAPNAPVFANEVGAPLRRSMFRRRVWRPSLVRAGLLGKVDADGDDFAAVWTDDAGEEHTKTVPTRAAAVSLVADHQAGGLRFHDLRHSYATTLVDDGVPPT